jgi:hypothetical protein
LIFNLKPSKITLWAKNSNFYIRNPSNHNNDLNFLTVKVNRERLRFQHDSDFYPPEHDLQSAPSIVAHDWWHPKSLMMIGHRPQLGIAPKKIFAGNRFSAYFQPFFGFEMFSAKENKNLSHVSSSKKVYKSSIFTISRILCIEMNIWKGHKNKGGSDKKVCFPLGKSNSIEHRKSE